jgi:hypothetical protein
MTYPVDKNTFHAQPARSKGTANRLDTHRVAKHSMPFTARATQGYPQFHVSSYIITALILF